MATPEKIGGYRVERALGTGGFATVWLGYDDMLQARVAIKVLAENWTHDLRVRERFLEEGRLLWRLDDERLIRVHAVGQLDDDRPYLVMAWADRGSLRDRLKAGPLPFPVAMALLAEITAGVAVLHRRRVVHRDLSPGNILFRSRHDGREQVLIADLGLAKMLANSSGLTMCAGTPGYMAPEQADPLAQVDLRTDVFALGVLGRAMLREGATVPTALARLFDRACSWAPDDRFADALEFGQALEQVARSLSAHPPRPAPSATGTAAAGNAAAGWPPSPTEGGGSEGGGSDGGRGGRRPALRSRSAAALAGLVVLAAGIAAAARITGDDATTSDTTGRITVTLPDGWSAAGNGWTGRVDAAGDLEPGLVISPDPGSWSSDPGVPGAFVGLSPSLATETTPDAFVDGRPHSGCTRSAPLTTRYGTLTWTVLTLTACTSGRNYVEAAALAPAGLVYVQLSGPQSEPAPSADALLTGISVR